MAAAGAAAAGTTNSTILSSRGEPLFTGPAAVDANRRHVLTRIIVDEKKRSHDIDDAAGGEWTLIPEVAAGAGFYRLRNAGSGEMLCTGSNVLDANRRRVVTWIGGGDVEGDAAVWTTLPSPQTLRRTRRRDHRRLRTSVRIRAARLRACAGAQPATPPSPRQEPVPSRDDLYTMYNHLIFLLNS